MEQEILELLSQLIVQQEKKLYQIAVDLVGSLAPDDILQPFDYPELEDNPHFRHEEGVLEGLKTAQMAFFAYQRNKMNL